MLKQSEEDSRRLLDIKNRIQVKRMKNHLNKTVRTAMSFSLKKVNKSGRKVNTSGRKVRVKLSTVVIASKMTVTIVRHQSLYQLIKRNKRLKLSPRRKKHL